MGGRAVKRTAAPLVPVLATLLAVLVPVVGRSEPRARGAASASSSSPLSRPPGFAPDPVPLVTKKKWVYEIVFDEGALFSGTPKAEERPKPTETPRLMGRFAVELWVGKTLLERVRFDFPLLLGDDDTKRPSFDKKLRAKATVEVPDTDRASAAVLVDRATGRRVRLFWPPADGIPSASASRGTTASP